MVQKGEDIPFSGLNRPAPKFKSKPNYQFVSQAKLNALSSSSTTAGFYDQKQTEQQADFVARTPSPRPEPSRSPTPGSLTYPASDYVPERPPTPQYIYSQHTVSQYGQHGEHLNSHYSTPTSLQAPSTHIYNQQTKTTRNSKRQTDFSSIDEWQRKITEDFNQLYSNMERNFELKRLRETGRLTENF